nr:asparagine--tRNA ligase, chloroplastic/mitochondrial [Tanacetum cinerariifolium]
MEKTQNKPKELLPYGMLLSRLFKHVVSVFPELAIDNYTLFDHVMHPLAPHYERKTRADQGKKRSRESNVSLSSSTLNNPPSSHPLDDSIYENDDESFHSNPSSPSQNISSSSNDVSRVHQNPPHDSFFLSMSCSNHHSNFSRKPRMSVRQVWKRKTSTSKSSHPSQNDSPPLPSRVYLQSPSPPSYNPLRDQMINQLHNISTILDSHNNPSNAYIRASPSSPPPQIHPPSHAQVKWGCDLQSEHKRYITEEAFNRCPVIITDYPKNIKSFYTRLNDDDKTVAAMDVLVPRVGELIGGSQREERLDYLENRLDELKLSKESLGWYRDIRSYGTALEVIFIGKKLVDEVPDTLMRLVENLVVWNDFRWGEYIWRHLYDQIMNVVNKNKREHLKGLSKSQSYVPTYNLSGFVWSFKVILDLTPTISEQQTFWYMAFCKFYMSYIPRSPPTTYTDLFGDYMKKLSSSRKRGKIDSRDLSVIRRCDTSSVKEIRLKDGVIAKLNSRVFKHEAIIKVLGRERKIVSLATDRVYLTDAFDICLGRQGPLRCWFPWCKDVSVDRRFGKSLLCLDPTKKGWMMDESCGSITCGILDPMMLIGPWLMVTLSSFSFKTRSPRGMLMALCTKFHGAMLKRMIVSVPTPYYSTLLGFNMDEESIIEAKILEVLMQAKVFDQKGIDDTRYTISFTNVVNVPKQGGVFGDCGPSTPTTLYTRPSIRPSYSARTSRSAMNVEKAECSNCNFLAEKIKTLEAKIKILEGTLKMERHPENHTIGSAAILHELYNDMGKLGLE